VTFFAWPILVEVVRLYRIGELREAGTFWVMFMAVAALIVVAWKRDDAARSLWMGIAAGLCASAAAVAQLAQLHVPWQGRVLGYAFLLFVAAHFGPKIRGMGDCAPQRLGARMKWHMRVFGLEALTIAIVTSAWSLAMPTGLGGDPAHPPAGGLLFVIVWAAAKRLATGGPSPITADGKRTLLLGRLVGTSGLGLLFMAAGIRGAVIGPNQSHPVSAEFAAAILISLGFWIERRVLRGVLGLLSNRFGHHEGAAS